MTTTTTLAAFEDIRAGFHQAGKYTYTYEDILADVTNIVRAYVPI